MTLSANVDGHHWGLLDFNLCVALFTVFLQACAFAFVNVSVFMSGYVPMATRKLQTIDVFINLGCILLWTC